MWLINKSEVEFKIFVKELTKFVNFKPNYPIQFETQMGLTYTKKYSCLVSCQDPEKYFIERPMEQMIVRDAGIGDLLLLEPVLRELHKLGNRNISVLSRYPEVYENNPVISNLHKASDKSSNAGLKVIDFDDWQDLRSYSEMSPRRHREHRTDIYNLAFNLKIKDKEPRLYFNKNETPLIVKRDGYRFIGVSVDASHNFRKYPYEKELIDHILKVDKKNIVVLLGSEANGEYKHRRVSDLRGKTTIRQMINCVRGLDYCIAVDSGVMHVALTLHIPTLCIFTIITADYRVRYYTGKYTVMTADLDCLGCGDWHMYKCKKIGTSDGLAPCQQLNPKDIYEKTLAIGKSNIKEYKAEPLKVNIIPPSKNKLTLCMIVQDEEKNLPRFIENVISHSSIGRVIAIDGGSKDNTVKLLEKAGAEVYKHPYLKDYHEMQAMQRNISCSYVKDGDNIIIMDVDECFSIELSQFLPILADRMDIHYGLISRRTFNYYSDINDPSKAIKDYPDYQPRFYKWNRQFKFVGGAHHITLNCPKPIKIDKDIIHFEKEGKDRDKLEKQWAKMMVGVNQYAGT